MRDEQEILRVVKQLGANNFEEGKDWNGKKVYIPVYSKITYVGMPLVIFDDGKELRLSTADEALDYINATTDLSNLEEDTPKHLFSNFGKN